MDLSKVWESLGLTSGSSAVAERAPEIMLTGKLGTLPAWFIGLSLTLTSLGLLWILIRKTNFLQALKDSRMNWRLALLILTGVALSLASGWTTWDGMTNFTREPALALLITFGIQAIMLILSWLIGESFVNASGRRASLTSPSDGPSTLLRAVAALAVILALVLLAIAILEGQEGELASGFASPAAIDTIFNVTLAALLASILAYLILNGGLDIAEHNLRSLRTVLANIPLWLMFLACLAASVFFSFDSLFSNIFPDNERARVSALRTRGQVAQLVSDLKEVTSERMHQRQGALINSPEWRSYTERLSGLIALAQQAPEELDKLAAKKLRQRQAQMGTLKLEYADAQSKQAHLEEAANGVRKRLEALDQARQTQSGRIEDVKAQIEQIDQQISAKVSEAEMEAGGFGATGKKGRGPKYREITGERTRLEFERKALQRQLTQAEQRLLKTQKRIAAEKQDIARITSQLVKLRVAAETSEKLMALASTASSGGNRAPKSVDDPSALIDQLGTAWKGFQRQPDRTTQDKLEQSCVNLVNAILPVTALKERASNIDCAVDEALPVAASTYALASGLRSVEAKCVGDGKLPQSEETGALLQFARDCIQLSGLTGHDAEHFHKKTSYVDLNRDDKAHRFVVTLNAFADGNKLAYLALAIALAMDGLVFMSGLFGANAARSPLSNLSDPEGRNAVELAAVVDAALLPSPTESAKAVLDVCAPVQSRRWREETSDWTHVADLTGLIPGSRRSILKVLNAAATIGAARPSDGHPNCYLVRSELIEYLLQFARQGVGAEKERQGPADLGAILTMVFAPNIAQNAAIVQRYLHPMSMEGDFSSFVVLSEVKDAHFDLVKTVLNAAATLNYVKKVKNSEGIETYYTHKFFFYALATVAADSNKSEQRASHQRAGTLSTPHDTEAPEASTAKVATAGIGIQTVVEKPTRIDAPTQTLLDEPRPEDPASLAPPPNPHAIQGASEVRKARLHSATDADAPAVEILSDPSHGTELVRPKGPESDTPPALAVARKQRKSIDVREAHIHETSATAGITAEPAADVATEVEASKGTDRGAPVKNAEPLRSEDPPSGLTKPLVETKQMASDARKNVLHGSLKAGLPAANVTSEAVADDPTPLDTSTEIDRDAAVNDTQPLQPQGPRPARLPSETAIDTTQSAFYVPETHLQRASDRDGSAAGIAPEPVADDRAALAASTVITPAAPVDDAQQFMQEDPLSPAPPKTPVARANQSSSNVHAKRVHDAPDAHVPEADMAIEAVPGDAVETKAVADIESAEPVELSILAAEARQRRITAREKQERSETSSPCSEANKRPQSTTRSTLDVSKTSRETNTAYLEQMVSDLNLDEEMQDIQNMPDGVKASLHGIYETLESIATSIPYVSTALDEVRRSYRDKLQRAYDAIRYKVDKGDLGKLRLLDAAKQEIQTSLPLLIILSKDGVFHHLAHQPQGDFAGTATDELSEQLSHVLPLCLAMNSRDVKSCKDIEAALRSIALFETERMRKLSLEVGMDVSELLAMTRDPRRTAG